MGGTGQAGGPVASIAFMTSKPFAFVYVIPLGRSALDRHRCADLLDSIRCCQPTAAHTYLVNDGNDERALLQLLKTAGLPGSVVGVTQASRGLPWSERLTLGLSHTYRRVLREFPDHSVCRLDTDALLVRPFGEAAARVFAADPRAGLIGSNGLFGGARRLGRWWARQVSRYTPRLVRWNRPPYFRQNVVGVNGLLRRHALRAKALGYSLGAAVCGGGYLFRAEAVRAVFSLPGTLRLTASRRIGVSEEVLFSILTCGAGFRLAIQDSPGDAFGIAWRGLPGRSLREVWERGNAIIHSLKSHGLFNEETTREFFRHRRARAVSPL